MVVDNNVAYFYISRFGQFLLFLVGGGRFSVFLHELVYDKRTHSELENNNTGIVILYDGIMFAKHRFLC